MINLLNINDFNKLVRAGGVDILIDARPVNEFDESHIPGAIHMPWEDWNEAAPDDAKPELHQPGYWGKLADPVQGQVAERLTRMGISNDSHIVIYADGIRSKGREGRLAWMLLYFGARNVSILNGGFRAWAQSDRVSFQPTRATDPFVLQLDERRRAYKADVQRRADAVLIDTRGSREFDGIIYDYQPRLGHIPGAINIPYRSLLRANGEFITRDEYLDLIPYCRRIIWYCEVGVRAATASILHELYTGDVHPVYDASFMEYTLDVVLPIENPSRTPIRRIRWGI